MKALSFPAIAVASLALLASLRTLGASAEPATIDLNGDWAFAYTPAHESAVPPARAFVATMPVPGCWDDRFDRAKATSLWPAATFNPRYRPVTYPMDGKPPDASLPYLQGTGWYLRKIPVPADWKSRQITLHVGRVVMDAWVYVNGREVHHHKGFSTTWKASLAPHLNYGEANEVVIAVDNTRADQIGTIIRGWVGRSTGIFGPVSLHVAGEAGIADLYVFPRDNGLTWRVELQGNLPKNAELRWRIAARAGTPPLLAGVQSAVTSRLEWQTGSGGMKPWSDRAANLYELETALYSGDRCLDLRTQRFGLRQLTTQGTGLRLNAQPVYLRGVCEHGYYPETCTPPTDLAWYRNHIRRLKEIGFNWLRFHTSVPLEPYLQAADELGMLIQVEAPAGHTFAEWGDILRFCRAHPSVVLYCGGNEEMLDEKKIEFLAQCAAETHATVPDALFNPHSGLRGVEYGLSQAEMKVLARLPFPHHAARLARLKEFSDVFGAYALGRLSYGTLQGEPRKLDDDLVIYERPCLSHEMGICSSYLDLSLEERYRPLRIGPDLFSGARENLRRAGLLERAPVYLRNSAAWQQLILKDAMETARHVRRLSGYDLLGANDAHWHRTGYDCGLLNEFDELKPGRTTEDIQSYNGESVLLISDQRERNLTAGRSLKRTLSLSWFGEGPLRNATLRVSLVASDGTSLARTEPALATVNSGTVTEIAALNLPTPVLARPTKASLHVELNTPAGMVRNQWDYWLFPEANAATPGNIIVVSALDANALQALAAGGRVVLLGSKPFPSQSMSFQMGLAGRPEGNLATVIARHPLTDGFPHDGYCDWQFHKMLTGATPVQFNTLADMFDPIIEVASSYKNIRKQAVLFECRVGAGRLLVCSLQLPAADPAAAYLRGCLLTYAAGGDFQPRTEISPDRLATLLGPGGRKPERPRQTDQGFDERGQVPKRK
jgi:hypothetical protein